MLLTFAYQGRVFVDVDTEAASPPVAPVEIILAAAKAALAVRIDAHAETLRRIIATPGAGQAMEYQQVQVEAFDALALAAGTVPDAAAYPMLAASIGLDIDPDTKAPATDVLGVARSVKAAFAAWLALGSAIRRARLKGKAAVDAAETIAAAVAAFDAIDWPSAA